MFKDWVFGIGIVAILVFTFTSFPSQIIAVSSGSSSSDINESDANGLYVKLNPLASQTINGFDLNIVNNSATKPTLTLNNLSGGATQMRLMNNNSITWEAKTIAGFPVWTCPAGNVYCGFINDTLTDGFVFSTVINSFIVDTQGVDVTTPLLFQSGAFRSTGTITGDGNVNAMDINAIGTYRGFKIGFDGRNGGVTSNWMPDNNKFKDLGIAARYWRDTYSVRYFVDKNITLNRDANINHGTWKQYIDKDQNYNFNLTNGVVDFENGYVRIDKNIYTPLYDASIQIALDTCYVNSGIRDLHLYATIDAGSSAAADVGVVTLDVASTCAGLAPKQGVGITNGISVRQNLLFQLHGIVSAGWAFQLTSQVQGTGTVQLADTLGIMNEPVWKYHP